MNASMMLESTPQSEAHVVVEKSIAEILKSTTKIKDDLEEMLVDIDKMIERAKFIRKRTEA